MKNLYYLKHPGEQKFYKNVALASGFLALNTEYWSWYNRPSTKLYDLQRYLVIIFTPVTSLSQIVYLYLNYQHHSFAALSVMFSIIPTALVIVVKMGSAHTLAYKKTMKAYMDSIHLYHYLQKEISDEKRKFVAEECITADKYTRWTFKFLMILISICFTSWNLVPVIHNFQNNHSIHNITVRLEVYIHFWQPFDYEFNFYSYLIMQVLVCYVGGVGTQLYILFETINFGIIFHLVGHIKIIKYDLEHSFTDDMDDIETKKKLIEMTNIYTYISSTFREVTAAFGLNVAAVYAQNTVQGGLLLYQLMTTGKNLDTLLTFGLMLPILMGVLILISFVLENVRIQADDIPTLVYNLPWERMSISNQKLVMSIIVQVQPTLEFVAAFNIKTGVQPAINIIKTTFSYYVMIKSSKE